MCCQDLYLNADTLRSLSASRNQLRRSGGMVLFVLSVHTFRSIQLLKGCCKTARGGPFFFLPG